MSLEAVAGVGLLAFTVLCSLVGGAYKLGQHSNRIESLEQRQDRADVEKRASDATISDIKAEMSGVRAEMKAMRDNLRDGLDNLTKLITGRARSQSGG